MRLRANLGLDDRGRNDRARRVRRFDRRPECGHDSVAGRDAGGGIGEGLRRAPIRGRRISRKLDESVRRIHPAPFTIHTEAEWTAKLAELRALVAGVLTPDEQLVQLASLVGLLDTHSYLDWRPGAKFYEVLLYQFSDGIYAIRAAESSLIGARLVSINGVSAEEVTKRLAPLVPHDNESGLLDSVQGLYSSVEYLHGSGIVDDPAKPGYRFQRPAGEVAVVNPGGVELSGWENEFGIVGDLMGEKPEAVARRTEPTWWRTETKSHVFLLPTTTMSIRPKVWPR